MAIQRAEGHMREDVAGLRDGLRALRTDVANDRPAILELAGFPRRRRQRPAGDARQRRAHSQGRRGRPARHVGACRILGAGRRLSPPRCADVVAETGMFVRQGLGLAVRLQAGTLAHPSALAQLVEQLTVNQRVAGSSPAGGAISHRVVVPEMPARVRFDALTTGTVTALPRIVCYAPPDYLGSVSRCRRDVGCLCGLTGGSLWTPSMSE